MPTSLEREYWPEWNERFVRLLVGMTNMHRALIVVRRYQLARQQVKVGMRRKSLRIELQLSGALRARFRGQYVEPSECGVKVPPAVKTAGKAVRKDHNRGGKSKWMNGFFERPGRGCGKRHARRTREPERDSRNKRQRNKERRAKAAGDLRVYYPKNGGWHPRR
jgi:hypothetical protein